MRNSTLMIFLIIGILFMLIAVSFAQNFTERYLPEGAIARFGKGRIYDFVYSPDGTQIAVASTIGIWLHDALTGKALNLLTGHKYEVHSVNFSPDGKTLASGSYDATIILWDVGTGHPKKTLTGHTAGVRSVAFSPDGRRLASGGFDETIRFWDVDTGALLRTVPGHIQSVRTVVFSPNGKMLASCGHWDHNISLWDVDTGEFLSMFTGHSDSVVDLAFSPDGSTLASGSRDGTIRLWDTNTGQDNI